ncbi:hypothetical protein NP233_g8200 [Leucocoprinus birnbaumii]|uniref:Aquaporin n=1 Tax=Leucocoprinus birnbaumii TaxID=56174 RepID=A0AAD5YU23_9AGAR|nr:hypothetical protein NP233_g8200 [Leucocoprinus birnbaumii]
MLGESTDPSSSITIVTPVCSDIDLHEAWDESSDTVSDEDSTGNSISWSKYRLIIREATAEFLAVMIVVIFGIGVDCQVMLSMHTGVASFPQGDPLTLRLGWAIGGVMGNYLSGGISGGHINPAVGDLLCPLTATNTRVNNRFTLALAVFRGFSWKKVPKPHKLVYMLAQLLGATVGSTVVYANYISAINIVEGGRHIRTRTTASLFCTYALDYTTNISAFFSEFLATAILMCMLLAFGDHSNMAVPASLAPFVSLLLTLGIGVSLGMQTGYTLNPARDLGSRFMTAMVGYGLQAFTYRNQYWLWCSVMAPFIGCLAGAGLYDVLLFTGKESIVNRPTVKSPITAQLSLSW